MRLVLVILAVAGLSVLTLAQAPAGRTYTVTWTAIADPGRTLTGKGTLVVWTYRALLPTGKPPPLPQTRLYELDFPAECKGRQRCTLATYPLPDPSVLRRVIVSSKEAGPVVGVDIQAAVTVHKSPGTY